MPIFCRDVPRIVIALATAVDADNQRNTYLAFKVQFSLVQIWQESMLSLEPTTGGVAIDDFEGAWNRVRFSEPIPVCLFFEGYCETIEIHSEASGYQTRPIDLDKLSDVFFGAPKPHVVLGSKEFVASTGARVVARLQERSLTYREIESAIAHGKPEPFEGWCPEVIDAHDRIVYPFDGILQQPY